MEKLNSLAGSLTSSAVNYAFTGEATFNVLNVADLVSLADFGNSGTSRSSSSSQRIDVSGIRSGLFEVTVGKKGISSRIGTGGTDLSFSALTAALDGLKESKKIVSWKYGDEEKRSTLNAINMLGWTKKADDMKLSREIWGGKKKVKYEEMTFTPEERIYGSHDNNDNDTVVLNSILLGDGKEKSAVLASVLAHEGSHAYGERIEAEAYKAGLDTYVKIIAKFGAKADETFILDSVDGILAPENQVANDDPVQFMAPAVAAVAVVGVLAATLMVVCAQSDEYKNNSESWADALNSLSPSQNPLDLIFGFGATKAIRSLILSEPDKNRQNEEDSVPAQESETIAVSPEEEKALLKKMEKEIEGIKSKDRGKKPTEQYALVAKSDGYYPDVRGGVVYLLAGEVWKYGQTSNPERRYSGDYLDNLNLDKKREYQGSKADCLIMEKLKIYGYYIENGHLPPGNKIFR